MTRKKTATKAVAKKAKSPERKAAVRPSSKAASTKGAAAKSTAKVAPKAAKPDATRKGSVAKKLTASAGVGKKAAKPAPAATVPKPPSSPPKPTLEPVAVGPSVARPATPSPAARALPAAATVAKGAAQKIAAPATPKAVAERTALARQQAASKKPVNQRHGFKTNEWIVYPAHGVGRIVGIEEQEIAGISLELFVITFEKDKMTLRVPTGKSQSVGMRKLAEEPTLKKAMETLRGKARVKRTMWSRRAQ
jgi:CarD family transcriptional regulator